MPDNIITVMDKVYKYSGRSAIWKMINPKQVMLFDSKGILVWEWPAVSEKEAGEWMEVFKR